MVMRRFGAPGRVNLVGDHTDYTGGLALPAALDREVTITGVVTDDGRVVLRSETVPGDVDVPADGSAAPAGGWGRYVSAVAAQLAALGRAPVGFRGAVTSTVPTGAGVSSSAALEMAVGTALCAVANLELAPVDLARACQRAENTAVGVPSGILDQASAAFGRAGHAMLLDCATVTADLVPLPDRLALLIVESAVRRELEGSPYARRRAELEEALPLLGGRGPADVDPVELPAIEAAAAAAGVGAVPLQRLRHVVTENARVRASVALLRAGDVAALGPVFAASQDSMRDDFENSTPEVDALVGAAVASGALAARMTGGGFGGAVVALVSTAAAEAVAARTVDAYREATGLEATVHHCRAGDGAGER